VNTDLHRALPGWADPFELDRAVRLFERRSSAVMTAVFCSALPQCLAFPEAARALAAQPEVESNLRLGLVETARFVAEVARPGGLTGDWRALRPGFPVSQQQLLGATLAFSTGVTDALQAMRFALGEDEVEAWFHLWRVVGFRLGLEEAYLPPDAVQGRQLMHLLRERCWGGCPEGVAQAQATLALMQEMVPIRPFVGLPAALVRFLAGDRCAGLLAVPRADFTQKLLASGALVFDEAGPGRVAGSALAEAAQRACSALMQALGELSSTREPAGAAPPPPQGPDPRPNG
jgi:ER-bound oxygenase mpaB/B'/Rubber oxygenase, catalytic domain